MGDNLTLDQWTAPARYAYSVLAVVVDWDCMNHRLYCNASVTVATIGFTPPVSVMTTFMYRATSSVNALK